MPYVAVVGSVNMDLIVRLARLPRPGETLLGSDATYARGGKGANQAVAAARLGASTYLVGKVGHDAFGAQIRRGLEADGIDTSFLGEAPHAATGVAVIMLVGGDNTIVVASGANLEVSVPHVQSARDALARSKVLLNQLEIPLDAVAYAMDAGRRAGALTILDPAPAQRCPDSILNLADYLTPNQFEAGALTGVEVCDWDTARRAGHQLLKHAAKGVVVKMGRNGALVLDGQTELRVEGIAVDVVDTTAAGDGYCAALAVALASGASLVEAARFANVVGAITVTRLGAQPSLPKMDEVRRFIAGRGMAVAVPGTG